jgi:F-type H+-transporting ATPase subunit alpha
VANLTWPAAQVASRKLHVSCSKRAAEISSILEERILGSAPKVCCCVLGRIHILASMLVPDKYNL